MKQNQIHNLLTVKYKLCEVFEKINYVNLLRNAYVKEMNERGDLVFCTPLSGSMFGINQKER
jgi:hypothetical protein